MTARSLRLCSLRYTRDTAFVCSSFRSRRTDALALLPRGPCSRSSLTRSGTVVGGRCWLLSAVLRRPRDGPAAIYRRPGLTAALQVRSPGCVACSAPARLTALDPPAAAPDHSRPGTLMSPGDVDASERPFMAQQAAPRLSTRLLLIMKSDPGCLIATGRQLVDLCHMSVFLAVSCRPGVNP